MYRILLLSLVTLLAVLQYRMWFGESNVFELAALEQEITAQSVENDKLLLRNHQLEAEVKDLRKGLIAVEERARSELGMLKPNETFYQLINTAEQ
ncbi:MAG: cell division protein ftsB-like protein [Osedax symbiont Rs1]|nr:MAG: cell division protein ftsB-like protein [Osedax symbiont Rs1]